MHAPRPAARVLVVDRHRGLHDGIAGVLTELGHAVSCCRTAGEALDLASIGGPLDLLVTEIELSDIPGFELFRRVRQLHPRLRVVFLTAGPTTGPGLLPKPFSPRQLQHAVRRALAT